MKLEEKIMVEEKVKEEKALEKSTEKAILKKEKNSSAKLINLIKKNVNLTKL